ncbi:MAG: NlpC/P60 family protein [Chitinophagales bacterium]
MPNLSICHVSNSTVYTEPNDSSDVVSMVLFGESVKVIDFSQKWSQVLVHNNQCKGWVHTAHFAHSVEVSDSPIRCIDFTEFVHHEERRIPIFIGCQLPNYDGIRLHYGDYQWNFSGQSIHSKDLGMERFKRLGQKYIGAPYRKGGRSPFGIDDSGLVHILYSFLGKSLPRSADKQSTIGHPLHFIQEAQLGDLLGFSSAKGGPVDHIGLYWGNQQVLHVDSVAQIDQVDHNGIYHASSGQYTYFLTNIQRIIDVWPNP